MARYPLASFVGANKDNFSTQKITHKRVVIHIESGTESGTQAWFNNPSAQVSAHFGNPKVGPMQQFVDTDEMAYHCAEFNPSSIGIENEGLSGEILTANQLKNLRNVLNWIHRVHGTPLIYTGDPNVAGVIGHGHLPEGNLSHPNCPGGPVLIQVNKLLASMRRRDFVAHFFHRRKFSNHPVYQRPTA